MQQFEAIGKKKKKAFQHPLESFDSAYTDPIRAGMSTAFLHTWIQ